MHNTNKELNAWIALNIMRWHSWGDYWYTKKGGKGKRARKKKFWKPASDPEHTLEVIKKLGFAITLSFDPYENRKGFKRWVCDVETEDKEFAYDSATHAPRAACLAIKKLKEKLNE